MSELPSRCEHAESTTLLWLYGEAPDEHASHVADCAACSEVARLHAEVSVAIAPIAAELSPPPSVEVEVEPLPEPANTRSWTIGVAVGLLAAAAVLLALFGALGLPGGAISVPPIDDGAIAERPAPELPAPSPEIAPTPSPDVATPGVSPEDERIAEALLDEAFGGDFDADFEALYDDFEALEADLATL